MLIFGFKLADDDDTWEDNPFLGANTPEEEICEACHVYWDTEGNRYIGFELALGMPRHEMYQLLTPHSDFLTVYEVV